ncbi:ATPase, T2SS/T4P/T4SS family [Roseiterribacter gracilis]|uniref:Bacterial type II secretion system protein E domain-containing protein n=1 Tax=Roseiterribacter gracilis TaxID=2812848 RepID=A0A8S8XJC5_9PROT|nr:hypothetical protein TMPK1_35120 [Rhodospirillales bacterium TMPK1]
MAIKDHFFADAYINASSDGMLKVSGQGLIRMPDDATNEARGLARDLGKEYSGKYRERQITEFAVKHDEVVYRVAVMELDDKSLWFVLRRQEHAIRKLHEIGFPESAQQRLIQLGQQSGLLVLSGATGSGKTTTACALGIKYLETYGDVLLTIESPCELPMYGPHGYGYCFPTECREDEFHKALAKALRMHPRYILLGEIRYPNAAQQALRAALSGHLVITTIHGGDPIQALQSLLQYAGGEDPDHTAGLLANGFLGIIHQDLIGSPARMTAEFLLAVDEDRTQIQNLIRTRKMEQLKTMMMKQATLFGLRTMGAFRA